MAYVLTATIGWERERDSHSVGIRTFPIVGMASCGYLMVLGHPADAAAQSRLLQGLITASDLSEEAPSSSRIQPCTVLLPPQVSGTQESSALPSPWIITELRLLWPR